MLLKQNIALASRLAVGLEDYAIAPLENSPLSAAVSASLPVAANPVGQPEELIHNASMQEGMGGVVQHDLVSEEVNDQMANAVRSHFNFARNVVKTAINTTVAEVQDAVASSEMPNYSIVSLRPAAILLSPYLEDLVGRYNATVSDRVALPAKFPMHPESKLVEMVRTGSAEFDSGIADLIAGHPAGWLTDLWKTFFCDGGHWDPSYDLAACDAYVVIGLWCNYLMDNVPEAIGYTLEEYNLVIANLMAQSGRTVISIMEQYDGYEGAGIVVLEYPPKLPYLSRVEDGMIKVYGPSYEKFLLAGGTPEIIFGSAFTDCKIKGTDLLNARQQYEAAYGSMIESAIIRHNASLNQRLWVEVGVAISRNLLNMPKEHLNDAHEDALATAQTEVKNLIANLGAMDIRENLYQAVRMVYCKAVFGHTDAGRILEGIDNRQAVNPNESLMDSAYFVAVDIVTDFWLGQAQVTKL